MLRSEDSTATKDDPGPGNIRGYSRFEAVRRIYSCGPTPTASEALAGAGCRKWVPLNAERNRFSQSF